MNQASMQTKHSSISRSSIFWRARLVVVVISIALMAPMVTGIFATDHELRSDWEKRSLHDWPAWTGAAQAAQYFTGISAYLDDHVGAALTINRLYRKILFFVFEDDPVAEITRGTDGFSYLNTHFADKPLSVFEVSCVQGVQTQNLHELEEIIRRVAEFYERRGLRVSMGIAPSKPVLYPEHLPNHVPERLRAACLQYGESPNIPGLLSRSALAEEWPLVYPYEEFYGRRRSDSFYPRENFHSTGESAHTLAGLILTAIDLPPGPEYSQGRQLAKSISDLHMKGFHEHITVWNYPYMAYGVEKSATPGEWENRYFPRPQDYALYRSRNPMAPDRKALLISNSFGAFIAGHLAPGFSELVNLNINRLHPREYQAVLVDYVDRSQFTDVIFILHDYSLIQGYKFAAMDRFFTLKAR